MAAEQLYSAFPSSPIAALWLTPPFAAGRRRKGGLGCQLTWGPSREFQGCSWPACREPQTQTPAGWQLVECHKAYLLRASWFRSGHLATFGD